jgi:AcrR family transcriptional regulator
MKQSERRQQSSDKLINAYLELAAEEGVSALTFDKIGIKAGYSRNLAVHKFGSKSGLLDAVITHLHDSMEEVRHEADLETLSGLDALLLYCEIHFESLEDQAAIRAYFVLLSEAIATLSDVRPLFAQSHVRSNTELRRLFARGLADGSLRKDVDIEMAVMMITTQLIGMSCQYLIDPAFPVKAAGAELQSLIRNAYGTSKRVGVWNEAPPRAGATASRLRQR